MWLKAHIEAPYYGSIIFGFNYAKVGYGILTIIYKNEFIWIQKILVIINSFEILISRLIYLSQLLFIQLGINMNLSELKIDRFLNLIILFLIYIYIYIY